MNLNTKQIKLYCCALIIAFVSLFPVKVSAYDNNHFYSSNDILFYDGNETNVCISAPVGNDNIEKTLSFLLGKGLSLEQASGVIGNFMKESTGINPTAIQNSSKPATEDYRPVENVGFGIVQWTSAGRQQGLVDFFESDSENRSIIDLSLQLDYFWQEFTGNYSNIYKELKQQTDPVEAAIVFHKYEGSGDSAETVKNVRGGFATSTYNEYKNSGLSGGNDSDLCLGGTYADGFMFYDQKDPAWADVAYLGGTVGDIGCGVTSMAMIITALTGQKVTPDQTATYMDENRGLLEEKLPAKYGLNSEKISNEATNVNDTLNSGGLVIAYANNASSPFSKRGHYIVIRAVTSDGKWLIGDPDNEANNTKEFDPANLLQSGGSTLEMWAITP